MNGLLFNNEVRFRLLRHIFFFLITVIVFASVLFIQNNSERFIDTFWITFINALLFFSYAYITIFLLIPEFLMTKKVIWFILLFLLVGIGLSALKTGDFRPNFLFLNFSRKYYK